MWVEKLDPAGVREPRPPRDNRYGENAPSSPGMAGVWGNVPLTDGAALDARLEEIAATMCGTDPRTTAQRRADALIALAAQQTRLHCGCGLGDCPVVSADATPLGQVVLHVLADQGALTGAAHAAGYLPGFGAIPVAQLRELAESATVTPLPIPPPVAEPGYRPSAAMTEFVRGTSRLRGTDLALARV